MFAQQNETGLPSCLPVIRKCEAFTLAEVLVTLGIIGVVAALTMPVLNTKIQRNILNQQFRKSYNTFFNAFSKSVFDMDNNTNCYYYATEETTFEVSGCYEFWFDNFVKNLKLVKTCIGNAFEEGCIPDYHFVYSSPCRGFSSENIKQNANVYVAADGTIFIPYSLGSETDTFPVVLVDVNGKKGPNKAGYDVFTLAISKRGNSIVTGKTGEDGSEWDRLNFCLPTAEGGITYMRDIIK